MLKVTDINVYYGNIHAIKGVSFDVHQGEIVTLIGANGAGKSTILKAVSGLLRSKTGSISFLDSDIGAATAHNIVRRGLVQVPEGRRIFLKMSVQQNLEMGNYIHHRSVMNEKLEDIFTRFPRLKERRKQLGGTLSGGEQQMLAIGRAMMTSPQLLMLDEPSMGLAPLLVEQIFDIITELNASGVTVLLVEQNARMALSVAHRGYVLETGRIVASAPADELLEDEAVRRAYLGG
ncbi:MAG: ABC transporter ATP-binding protein [Oscillospiraceae bacterium]|nr:ABC transporter ATP-binding protein [Oscillospiraceae bacterium]